MRVCAEPAFDANAGTEFTHCVDGMPVSFRSTTESGGISPDIPISIIRATVPVPPLSGGTLLLLADGTTVVISDPERDQLYVVDESVGAVRATVPLRASDEPGRLAEDGAGRVHVVLRRGGALVTIDPTAGVILARTEICPAPRGIAYHKERDEVHVACAGGELVSLPAGGGAVTRRLQLDRDLRDVVVAGDGSLYVSTFRNAELLGIKPSGEVAQRLRPASERAPSVTRASELEMRTPSVAWRIVPLDAGSGRRTHASPNGCGRCCRHGSWWVRWQGGMQWRHRASGPLASGAGSSGRARVEFGRVDAGDRSGRVAAAREARLGGSGR